MKALGVLVCVLLSLGSCNSGTIGGTGDGAAGDAPADLASPSGDGGGSVDKPFKGCGLRTCASVGATCGPIGDGCGGVLQCGTCTPPQTCGGGGQPSAHSTLENCVVSLVNVSCFPSGPVRTASLRSTIRNVPVTDQPHEAGVM